MNTEILKQILYNNRKNIEKLPLVKRNVVWEESINYVVVGMRQSGKSYLLYQKIQELINNGVPILDIVYLNFDDERLQGIDASELSVILDAQRQMSENKPILFLDEIQNIDGWEHFARRMANEKYRVYITGSNAKMLSKEVATTLGGRYMIQEMYPFSFSEFLRAKNVEREEFWSYDANKVAAVRCEFDDYIYYGGFPESINLQNKRAWLTVLYQKIFLGDIAMRYQVRKPNALKMLVRKMAESVKQPVSFNRLANLVSSAGEKVQVPTIIDFISYLEDSWLMFSVCNYASRFVERESNKKYYFRDNGILNLFLNDQNTSLLENLVAITLKKRYGDELYYYSKGDYEVDFYVPKTKTAYQVSWSIENNATKDRELTALTKVGKHIEAEQLIVITYEEEETFNMHGKEIKVLPIWRWVLG